VSCGQAHAGDKDGRKFVKLAAPGERAAGLDFGREGAFFESVEDEAVLESEVEVGLERAMEVELRFGLVAQGQPVSLELAHVAAGFDGVLGDDFTAQVAFFEDMDGCGVVEGRVYQAEDKNAAGLKDARQGVKERLDVGDVEQGHVA